MQTVRVDMMSSGFGEELEKHKAKWFSVKWKAREQMIEENKEK